MLDNIFKSGLRALTRNKTYSFLNIFGLAIGIACAGMIFLWVEDELSFDSVHVKKDRLYGVRENWAYSDGVRTYWSTPGMLGPAMRSEIPGIASTCRKTEGRQSLLFSIGDKHVYAGGCFADSTLFNMFTLPFVQGNAQHPFAQPYSIVITEKTAKKFFGDDRNVVGRSVRMDKKQDYVVTGVLMDMPENSSLQFEWVASFDIYFRQNKDWLTDWASNGTTTYVELNPSVNPAAVDKQLYNFIQQRAPNTLPHAFLFSMNDWNLYDDFANGKQTGGGRIEYVRLFTAIACIILFIACINFMNLSTARSEKRAREVGVRKVLGAGKGKLIAQFIGESIFMAMLAAFAALIIISIALPSFNILVQKDLVLGLSSPVHIISLATIILVCGLVAGSYPSLYLSSFNPVFVLKGIKLKTGSAAFIRKGLVVVQFTVSIILIISTVIIYQQIQHVKSRQLGFAKNNLVELGVQGDMVKNFAVIKQDLINTGLVENAALSDHSTIYGGNNTDEITWSGKEPGKKILISNREVSPEFMSASGIPVIEGRDFQAGDSAVNPGSLHVIITESLAKMMGQGSPIGKRLFKEHDSTVNATVIGVVKDFVYGDMYGSPSPVVFICMPQVATVMYVRTRAGSDPGQVIAKMEAVMQKDNPAYPFDYRFVDDQFNAMFKTEMLIGTLSRVFAMLTIIISCLGLFGLAAYTAERRFKEIGIRKVLGASVPGVAGLLSIDFLKLVFLSAVIAFPLAWWFMHKWLEGYAYRVDIAWWVFAVAGLGAMFIAVATISWQAVRAALANPVKSLRSE